MADDDDDDVQIPQPLHYVNLSLSEKLIFIKTFLHFNYKRKSGFLLLGSPVILVVDTRSLYFKLIEKSVDYR